ncbi:hypothetical protein LOD99_1613 [Oopsacas minuta]|uniref:ceramide glucosyltransferase n=1 Tax=Oopsacas minuta TaxID=111878 RepID=A0AAV7K606_9METZ|nr:hypothetical protein LOD99_1613 [Oopsacas minuta]
MGDIDDVTYKERILGVYWYLFSVSGVLSIISYIFIGLMIFIYFCHIVSILYAKKFLYAFDPYVFLQLHPKDSLPSVSIIKPLKGSDVNLYSNLESYFKLNYPKFEIIFCIQSASDPAHEIVDRLIRDYPSIKTQKIKGFEPKNFENPKVTNLVPGISAAEYDLVWMADANICVEPNTLLEMTSHIMEGGGLVHQLPLSKSLNHTLAECLEVVYFYTSHARVYLMSSFFGFNSTNGMSMLFPKDVLNEITQGLKKYFFSSMEDNRIGKDFVNSKRTLKLSRIPLYQNFGSRTIDAFRQRMVRWTRIRMYFMPWLTFEPCIECFPTGVLCSFALYYLYGVNPFVTFPTHVLLWFISDATLSYVLLNKPLTFDGLLLIYSLAWLIRETLVIPNFIQAICSKKIYWSGHDRTLKCCTDEYVTNT